MNVDTTAKLDTIIKRWRGCKRCDLHEGRTNIVFWRGNLRGKLLGVIGEAPGEAECVMYVMYENTSEGTPISPAFETPEALARWLADTGASSFAGMTATYERWLNGARGGYAPSMVMAGGHLMSGVESSVKE